MTTRSGGLLELVARGKKDVFFTANPTVSFFHSAYVRAAAFTKEIYVAKPRNVPDWGQWLEFDLDHRGDLVRHFYLRIELPSWLPQDAWLANARGIVTDLSGVTYGWCNNIGLCKFIYLLAWIECSNFTLTWNPGKYLHGLFILGKCNTRVLLLH